MRVRMCVRGWLVALCLTTGAIAQVPQPLRAGSEFQPSEIRNLQKDEFANPAMLWVTEGKQLWHAPRGKSGKSCADCHDAAENSMKGVATRFPNMSTPAGRVLNLEGQINVCTVERQQAPPLEFESDGLLALTAYVAAQSRGMPMATRIDGALQPVFEEGQRLYNKRVGQLNLACRHCHQDHWGKRLLTDAISQGHGSEFPAYRFEWQKIGSLQRRLRACFFGLRAEMPDYGSPDLLALEVYLAWRANGLALDVPGVRK